MDNSQFRTLLQSNENASAQGAAASPPGFKKPALGSRSRASIPMTPRSIAGHSASRMFAQQVADYRKEHDGQPPKKKFKSSAPKGTKLGSGYEDRTLARREGADDAETTDDKQKRLKALEEMYKLQQIDEATFEHLKSEIGIGGDLSSTHLVKGLDWKLLDRVRRGDDLNSAPQPEENEEKAKVDVDEELDHLLEKEVQAVDHSLGKQQDDAGMEEDQPMTRDEILRRLKESRAQKQQGVPPEPVLGNRFKKVTSDKPNKRKFTEVVNGRRREVLLITNKDGTTKRKTRWIDVEEDTPDSAQKQPLGMEVPAEFVAKQQVLSTQAEAEDEDDDIFQGVSDYNPLAGINSDSEDEDHDKSKPAARAEKDTASTTSKPRNYFATSGQEGEAEDRTNPILKDPTLLSALKRAAGLKRHDDSGSNQALDSDPTRVAKQQQLLERLKEQNRADAADLDLGFGESRFGDDEDEDGSVWEDGEGSSKKSGRKRGPKKRKGDKDNVNDVMAVMRGRDRKS
ncbi:hypothetical protein G647_09103 [Cladophialophora carrionii CBS 160.54]|uniref:RED-like N-terminal domain-containing protein n=1 Tax=Cladophialophora carrionii CBS 160.54 TaxID=1279043 RepID=V9CY23_9EURO|nr:uncharacterized protein G647_09103 [Cladophialophora carrionii CBS 160.54]ETI19271.1 hypothetical protein G647_09103 [Cladophialophora carrionii CBS 160.54]